jgi:hypothetical protein
VNRDIDPFELIRRIGRAPLGPLVAALRELHEGADTPAVLQALTSLRDSPLRPGADVAAIGPARRAPDYETARRHFVQHATRLREQTILAERLLDGLVGSVAQAHPARLPEDVIVRCAPGSTSRARFVVANHFGQSLSVRLVPGRLHGLSAPQAAAVQIGFEPEQLQLSPGAEREVEISIEVKPDEALPDVIELGVDVLGNEQVLLKQWVRIATHPEGRHDETVRP